MAIESLRPGSSGYSAISEIDPLELDRELGLLPKYNKNVDVGAMINATEQAVDVAGRLEVISPEIAIAALRDFDFLIASLHRHGVEPMPTVDNLEPILLRMGDIACSVPRGTVATYASANPTDHRRRSFTGSVEEEVFINGLNRSFDALDRSVHELSSQSLENTPAARPPLVEAVQTAATGMQTMVDAIVDTHHKIPPEYFIQHMRPYFDPVTIDGIAYSAPGGGQMPLVALDGIIWGLDRKSEWRDFYDDNYPYLTASQRGAMDSFATKNKERSITGQVIEETRNGNQDHELTAAAISVLKQIKKFRYPHLRVARNSFGKRPQGAVGSGNYTPNDLESIVTETDANLAALKGLNGADIVELQELLDSQYVR